MTSAVDICNLALSHIRSADIDSLTEAGTPAAACNLWYAPARDLALADMPWNFAGKTAALAKQVEVPNEWAFGYAYPTDCLKIRAITPPGKLRHLTPRIAYDVAFNAANNKTILTNQDEACATYTFRQDDPNQFDPHFVIALSYQLAVFIAVPIAGTSKGRLMRDDLAAAYLNAIKAAISANAGEQFPGPRRESEIIEAYGESVGVAARPIAS